MEQGAANVLLIGENEQSWCHLAQRLGHLGCRPWFASTTEEVRALIDQHSFRLILSTRPVTNRSPLIQMVEPECSVFYSVPVEDGCLCFQAAPESLSGSRLSALRPREFMSVLSSLIAEACVSRSHEVEYRRLRPRGSSDPEPATDAE
jgi:hypothetical protein